LYTVTLGGGLLVDGYWVHAAMALLCNPGSGVEHAQPE
jgi:hypothetical protein